jgi:teichuronic acid biosynthesis glycosyltransferase TuaG
MVIDRDKFQNDLVSIITPAFRVASVINETIDAVIAQTYPHWEMLIADDCSPDETRAVVLERAKSDPRIKLVALAANGGPATARNAALEHATGRWIAFLDSDDVWLPEKLERSIAHAKKRKAGLVFTGFRRISADGRAIGRYVKVPDTLTYRQLLGNTAIATSTVVIDRQIAGDIRMRKTYYDDFDCWLQILKRGHDAAGLNEDLMRYRVMSQSVSRNKRHSALHVWRAYRNLERLNLPMSIWYFGRYAIRGMLKYRKF